MKQKLTITLDLEVLIAAKRYARSRGVSKGTLRRSAEAWNKRSLTAAHR